MCTASCTGIPHPTELGKHTYSSQSLSSAPPSLPLAPDSHGNRTCQRRRAGLERGSGRVVARHCTSLHNFRTIARRRTASHGVACHCMSLHVIAQRRPGPLQPHNFHGRFVQNLIPKNRQRMSTRMRSPSRRTRTRRWRLVGAAGGVTREQPQCERAGEAAVRWWQERTVEIRTG